MKIRIAAAAAFLFLAVPVRIHAGPAIPKALEFVEPDVDVAVVVRIDFLDAYLEEAAGNAEQSAATNPTFEAALSRMADMRKKILPALSGEIVLVAKRPEPGAVSSGWDRNALVVAGVRDPALLDASLREMLEGTGGSLEVAPDGTTTFKSTRSATPTMCYRIQSGFLFLAMDPATIDRALTRERTRDGLHTSPAFLNAIADLRPDAGLLGFVRTRLLASPPEDGSAASESEDAAFALTVRRTSRGTHYELFAPKEGLPAGFPSFFPNFGLPFTGMAPAQASGEPAADLQKDTLNRIAEWGMFLERRRSQLKPTHGFVHLSSIAGELEGSGRLPLMDAWDRPLLYRFDGTAYTILSLGRNGAYDSTLLGAARQSMVAPDDLDLVLHDGRFVQQPGMDHPAAELPGSRPATSDELRAATPKPESNDTNAPAIMNSSIQAPSLANKVKPGYPEEARLSRVEGKVFLQAIITESGSVEGLRVLGVSAAPDLGLSQAAIDAVGQWTYEPARKDGKPVKVYFTVVVDFRLE